MLYAEERDNLPLMEERMSVLRSFAMTVIGLMIALAPQVFTQQPDNAITK